MRELTIIRYLQLHPLFSFSPSACKLIKSILKKSKCSLSSILSKLSVLRCLHGKTLLLLFLGFKNSLLFLSYHPPPLRSTSLWPVFLAVAILVRPLLPTTTTVCFTVPDSPYRPMQYSSRQTVSPFYKLCSGSPSTTYITQSLPTPLQELENHVEALHKIHILHRISKKRIIKHFL